ncbi:Down syndrome cell adhesion molecule-like protein, partial [Operophtera brumata]
WYRETAGGALREVRDAEGGGRYSRSRDAIGIRRAETADGGRWACRAANAHGHLTLRLLLAVVNSGGTAVINCTWGGWPAPRLEWLHNGVPLGAGVVGGRVRIQNNGEQLVISAVHRADKGVYQCMARNERDSAQASADLRLGDTAPELQYTFIEQVLRPGQVVTLKCSAAGSPPPHFTWMLDGQPLNTMARGHRYSVEQFATKTNDVVSYLNISAVRSEDGGLYTCRAANSIGEVSHTSRLNIYGPPYVRSIGPIRAVAGRELILYCPYSGYPITSVKWERDGSPVEWDSSIDGALRVTRVDPSQAGAYSCSVMGPHGEIAKRELQLVVSNPPEIEPFSFSANLQEGKRAQVSCSVTSGDMPVHFTWLKDNAPIPSNLQVEERGADFFSNLVFKEVSAHHSGLYTCVASNSAAKVNYTAELVVKGKVAIPAIPRTAHRAQLAPSTDLSPKWVLEPKDEAVLAGEALALHCQTSGSPTPQVTWMKQRDYVPLVNLGGRFQFLSNGTLWIESTLPYDEGHYMCKSENGPARFETTSHNMTARRDAPATLALSVSEQKTDSGLRSQLYISRADRQDSGVYKCQAVNAYGHSDHYIYLSVQEKPDTPHSLTVTEILSRAVRLSWSQGFDGNSPLMGYTFQHCALSAQGALRADQLTKKGDIHYEALMGNLKPHTAYMIRIAAINQIDKSAFTEPVVVKTQEEAPSEAPSNVHVNAGGAGELHVSWKPPPRDAWHGELLGYSVSCAELGRAEPLARNTTRLDTMQCGAGELHVSWKPPPRDAWHGELLGYSVSCAELGRAEPLARNTTRLDTMQCARERRRRRRAALNGWSATELSLSALRKFTRYEVRVRAFNAVAAGPAARISSHEGILFSIVVIWYQSIVESTTDWPARRTHTGIQSNILAHQLRSWHLWSITIKPSLRTFSSISADVGEIKRVTSTDTYLHTLRKYTNYSVQVLAFTNAGDGKRSPPVYCMTEEDVPSAPEKIKALAYSSDSVLVSWLAPINPNGIISHYTVYYREAGRLGKHSSFTVSADKKTDLELVFQVRNLMESQLYEFWVSATTGSGEGESTLVVGQGPSSRIPARIASFGGRVVAGRGLPALLACTCVGAPVPRSRWTHARAPVTHHQFYQDSIVYVVVAIMPPAAPQLSLQYTTTSSIKLHWQMPGDSTEPILGYLLNYKLAAEAEWLTVELSPEQTSYTMDMLKCGTTYNAKIQARNKISIGPPSEILTATTRGGRPKPPKPEDHVYMNSTAIKINFYAWRDGGCPILGFRVSYRRAGSEHWIKVAVQADSDAGPERVTLRADTHTLAGGTWYEVAVQADSDAGPERVTLRADTHTVAGGTWYEADSDAGPERVTLRADTHTLAGGTWYEVAVQADSDAGPERVTLRADTHTLAGGRIPALKPSAPLAGGGGRPATMRTVLVSCVASALVIVVTLAAIICLIYGKKKLLYEISPYATFGVSAAHSLQFRTLARRDDDAAPAQPGPAGWREPHLHILCT